MRPLLAVLLSGLPAFLPCGPAWGADCPLDLGHGTGVVVFSDRFMIALRPDPMRIEIGQPFTLLMNVCTKAGEPAELLRVDATIPEQGRGLSDAPTVKAIGNGRYRVEGLLFPIPGSWEVAFDMSAGGESQRLTYDFVMK